MPTFQEQQIREARAAIARAEEAERERIAAIVEAASVSTNKFIAERDAEQARVEAEREQARVERERARIEAEQERCRRAARAGWAGDDASFAAAWPSIWADYQREQAQRAIEAQRA